MENTVYHLIVSIVAYAEKRNASNPSLQSDDCVDDFLIENSSAITKIKTQQVGESDILLAIKMFNESELSSNQANPFVAEVVTLFTDILRQIPKASMRKPKGKGEEISSMELIYAGFEYTANNDISPDEHLSQLILSSR